MLELCRLRWMKTFHYFHHSINPRNLMTTGDKIFTWYVTSIIDIMCIFIFMIKSDKLWKVVFLEWRVQVQGLTVVQGQNSWTYTICWIFFKKSSSLHLPAFIWGMETKNWCFLSKLVKNSVFCSIVIPAGRTKGSLLFLQQVFYVISNPRCFKGYRFYPLGEDISVSEAGFCIKLSSPKK